MRPLGVLALQGDFDAHRQALEELGQAATLVKRPEELTAIDGLIIPGGESTTLIKLMHDTAFVDPLREFHAGGSPIYGTCAGAILLAGMVSGPAQFSLGLLDIDIVRNAYGRQRESFESATGAIEPDCGLAGPGMELILIRAPRIVRCGPKVEVLVRHDGDPVLVRQASVLAGTFHPELGRDRRVHQYFIDMARSTGRSGRLRQERQGAPS